MENEDKKRYFIVASIFVEVVTLLFQQKLEKYYKGLNFGCLKDFLDSEHVKHILFHLHVRQGQLKSPCCTEANCTNQRAALPLNKHQWKQLYNENQGPGIHNCFCKYTAKSSKPEDLDVSLCGLILYNCCNMGQLDEEAINLLRRKKNDHLSHNTTCGITKNKYGPLMDELKTNILQLDQTKEDDLIRIQKRQLDEALCVQYMTILFENHENREKIDSKLTEMLTISKKIYKLVKPKSVNKQSKDETTEKQGIKVNITSNVKDKTNEKGNHQHPPYQLGKPIFSSSHRVDISLVDSTCNDDLGITDMAMMDDGRLVMCLPEKSKLLIANSDISQVDDIRLKGHPWHITKVTCCLVAVTLFNGGLIEMYDINNKLKFKSISVPGLLRSNITAINNKLVVCDICNFKLLIIDYQTEEKVEKETRCNVYGLHGSGDKMFYFDILNNNKLYWYSYTDDLHDSITLPSLPRAMTTLLDGSLYVMCKDGSVQHVSSDGKQFETATINGLTSMKKYVFIYNSNQRKLITGDDQDGVLNFFDEN